MQQTNQKRTRHGKYVETRTKALVFILLLAASVCLASCTSHEKRSTGTVMNDQSLEYDVIGAINSDIHFGPDDHIKVEVHRGVVLLAGETVSEENSLLATKLASDQQLTKRVVNDLKIGEETGFGGRTNNAWMTTKVNSVLIKENPLPGFDASRIKVVSSQHTIYLMGIVSHEESDAIVNIVRNIGGVEKVVKIFDYTD